MRKKNGVCVVSDFPRTSRLKVVPVVVMSLLATLKLMAQNQNPPPPPTDASAGTLDHASPPQQAAAPSSDALTMPPPLLQAPKPTKHEVSVSGDVMMGSGTITLPLGYSLNKTLGGNLIAPQTMSVSRDSTYYGGTVSYSYGQAWYLDLSIALGQSSGNQNIQTGLGPVPLNSAFTIDDTWYQVFVKYTFPQLRGKRLSAYLRAGASFVTAELKDDAVSPLGRYTQTDTTQDLLGNLGAGLGYTVYSSRHVRFGLQAEAEAFYGIRSQESLETLSGVLSGDKPVSASIDNTLYGAIGRVTMRLEYRLGQSGLFKVFGEIGAEGRYTMIQYPGAGAPDELLWGPYAKIGLRYAF